MPPAPSLPRRARVAAVGGRVGGCCRESEPVGFDELHDSDGRDRRGDGEIGQDCLHAAQIIKPGRSHGDGDDGPAADGMILPASSFCRTNPILSFCRANPILGSHEVPALPRNAKTSFTSTCQTTRPEPNAAAIVQATSSPRPQVRSGPCLFLDPPICRAAPDLRPCLWGRPW